MTLNLRRKLLLIGAPVVLLGAGLTTMAASAATPTATASPSQQVEKQGTAAEAAEPASNADHQFDGVE